MPVWSGGVGGGGMACGMGQSGGQELDHLPAVRKLLFPPAGSPPPPPLPAVSYIKDALFMLGNQLMPVC